MISVMRLFSGKTGGLTRHGITQRACALYDAHQDPQRLEIRLSASKSSFYPLTVYRESRPERALAAAARLWASVTALAL